MSNALHMLASLEGMIGVTLENDEDGEVIKSLLIEKDRLYAYQLWTAYAVLRNPITWKVVIDADLKSADIHRTGRIFYREDKTTWCH